MWRDRAWPGTLRTPGRFTEAAVLGCAGALLIAACTTAQPRSSSSSIPSSSPGVSSGSATRPSHRTVGLSCTDATTSALAPTGRGNEAIDGLTFEGVGGKGAKVRGFAAADVGLHVPDGPPLYFLKAPVYVKPGALATTVELPVGSSGYLAWVPAGIWTGGGGQPIDLTRWMASRVVFPSCPHQAGTYLGGVLSTDRHICLTLRVYQPSAGGQRRQVHIGGTGQC